jgi:hypothetical protein
MSIQLIIYPQFYDGTNPISANFTQFVVDGINFNTVNTSNSQVNVTGNLVPTAINTVSPMTLNTWYRFSPNANFVSESSGDLGMVLGVGIMQKLSNLIVGVTYDIILDASVNASGINFYQYNGNLIQSTSVLIGTGLQSVSFTASSTDDIIAIQSIGVSQISSISVQQSVQSPSGAIQLLGNGQLIVDLYEDEDIPLTLSVDEFKNVAEQVQSYSKAFNLPATKRNNQIFDNIFEVTRNTNSFVFNPYVKTQCELKQDGFILFQGYLRLIDIQDKLGEISYNVNLYSEAIALADLLENKTFNDIDFTEIVHAYNKTNIKASWSTGVTYTNPSTSGFRTIDTVKYPFVDWNHQILIANGAFNNATPDNPELTSLEQAFRPFLNIKYLIDRIFDATPFSFTSDFFDTADFKKLYMDFNFGGNEIPVSLNEYAGTWNYGPLVASNIGNGSFKELRLIPFGVTGGQPSSTVPPNYDTLTYIITATTDNEYYDINYTYRLKNTAGTPSSVSCRWLHTTAGGVTIPINLQTIAISSNATYTGNLQVTLNTGDTLSAQFNASAIIEQNEIVSSSAVFTVSNISVNTATLNTLRGEVGQWEFLKGIMTMFNLVSIPDKDNINNIIIEPYNEVFLNNSDSEQLDWTEKIDVSEMKLIPLTDLNKNTIFKFVEDDEDYAFNVYRNSLSGFLYGSKRYDASAFTILDGTKEIIAEPFAATVPKPLMSQFYDFITPSIYSYNADDGTSDGFNNSPRIMFNNGIKSASAGTFTSCTYYIPSQNGVSSENATEFLQFSHLTDVPTITSTPPLVTDTKDFHFGECQLVQPIGNATTNNLFNTYWLPYFNELYNPDTRTMTLKVNLKAGDINTFKFYDTVIIKNREFRVNKIDYKPNDLATVEFILIP